MKPLYIGLIVLAVIIMTLIVSVAIGIGIYFATRTTETPSDSNKDGSETKKEDKKEEEETVKGPFYDNGVTVEVYDVDSTGKFGSLKETIQYKGDIWFSDSNGAKFFGKYNDHFGLKIKGLIKVPAGKHVFKVGHDDGAKLTVGDQTKEAWVLTGYVEDIIIEVTNDVEKMIPFELSYFEWEGGARLTMKMNDKRLPATLLYSEVQTNVQTTPPTFAKYNRIGCYADTDVRAIPDASESGYDNKDYQAKSDAINMCANFAKSKGFKGFAIQDGGQCMTSSDAHLTYSKYGPSATCANGKGAGWANEYYQWE